MKVLTSPQIKELDRFTIEHEPISSLDLMERAAKVMAQEIMHRWTPQHPVVVFAGPGNNGGDALAVARLLAAQNYRVEAFLFNTTGKLSPDCQANRDRLQKTGVTLTEVTSQFTTPELGEDTLVVDGLFGSGLNRPLTGGFAAVVRYINANAAHVVALDMPSGLFAEDNTDNISSHIIRAELTLTLQLPKLSFLFAENQLYLGEYQVLDIGLSEQGLEQMTTPFHITGEDEVRHILRHRNRFAHKGTMGHALLISGSYGMAGAALLATRACLRSGVGKVTVHTPSRNNDILQLGVPEAILHHDPHEIRFTRPCQTEAYQAVGIGPGIGTHHDTALALIEQILHTQCPLVLDADALNILGEHRGWLSQVPSHTILTPHVRELERLVGVCSNSWERLDRARRLAQRQQLYIILKGAWTAVIGPDGQVGFNPTGNPGMATAGSGDVLTGIILGLLAQGYNQAQTARLSTYLHGLAGDLASAALGQESLTAHDLITFLPKAFQELKK